jgi:hypothetical protein
MGQIQPSCSIATDGSLSPDSFRAPPMPVTEKSDPMDEFFRRQKLTVRSEANPWFPEVLEEERQRHGDRQSARHRPGERLPGCFS